MAFNRLRRAKRAVSLPLTRTTAAQPEHQPHSALRLPAVIGALALHSALASFAFVALPLNTAYAVEPIDSTTQKSYAIAPGPLGDVLAQFAAAAGVSLSFDPAPLADLRSSGLQGSFTAQQGFARLLSGSGYELADKGEGAYSLRPLPQTAGGTTTLPEVKVTARGESAVGPDEGYVAGRSLTATKTDTPLIETPQSISVITRDQLEDRGVRRFDEALRYTPGVSTGNFGFDIRQSTIQSRGFFATNQNIYRDGLQTRNPSFSVFLTPEPYGAERIEVLRGPASVLYGQGGPGGLVNYVTKRPTQEPFREVEIGAGNFDRYEGKFDVGGPIDEAGVLSYRLTGLARDSGTQVDFGEDDRIYIAPAFTWQPSEDTSLTLLGHYQDYDTGDFQFFLPQVGTQLPSPFGKIPLHRATGEPDFSGISNDEYMIASLFEHRLNETFSFRQNARYYHLETESNVLFGIGLQADGRTLNRITSALDGGLDGFALDNQMEARFATGSLAHTLLLGLDFQHAEAEVLERGGTAPPLDIFDPVYGSPVTPPTTVFLDTERTQRQVGLYLQDQIKLDRWRVSLGGRYDWADDETDNKLTNTTIKQDDNEFTGRAGLLYLADNGLAPYVSYSQSFLPVGGTNVALEQFKPETGEQYEVGIKYQPLGFNSFITLAAFDLTRQNVLTPDLIVPNNLLQTGEVRSRGIELEALASLDFGLDLTFAYTHLDVEITQSNIAGEEGNRPSFVPEKLASLRADYTFKQGDLAGLGLGIGVRYIGNVFGDNRNTVDVSDVTLVDAALRYDWGHYTFAVNVDNLFDKEYFAACSSFACNYGAARTVVGSLRYRFD